MISCCSCEALSRATASELNDVKHSEIYPGADRRWPNRPQATLEWIRSTGLRLEDIRIIFLNLVGLSCKIVCFFAELVDLFIYGVGFGDPALTALAVD